MNPSINTKAAIAAACLTLAAGLACAQSSPTPSNTTSPDPLQVDPVEGTPNSGTGKMTPGTGTGSSRTMRNETTPSSDRTTVTPGSTDRGVGNAEAPMTSPATGGSQGMDPKASTDRGTMRNGSGVTNNGSSNNRSDSMDNMDATGAGTSTRAARRDRG